MPFEFGDVVLVRSPFTSQRASKKRPAVVVSNRAYSITRPDLIVMAITSQLRPNPVTGDAWISHWQAAGLLKPSVVKPVFATLEQQIRARRTRAVPGTTADDQILRRVRAALDELYGDRIERVVVFGCRARGDAHEESDYDIAVFLKDMTDRWARVSSSG